MFEAPDAFLSKKPLLGEKGSILEGKKKEMKRKDKKKKRKKWINPLGSTIRWNLTNFIIKPIGTRIYVHIEIRVFSLAMLEITRGMPASFFKLSYNVSCLYRLSLGEQKRESSKAFDNFETSPKLAQFFFFNTDEI